MPWLTSGLRFPAFSSVFFCFVFVFIIILLFLIFVVVVVKLFLTEFYF